uniref:pyrin-like n=1 Tax=Podarcis muralis TaxID=64176 RepID=UPI0010A08845|nr:pyrin-like [Podarcis muralis]
MARSARDCLLTCLENLSEGELRRFKAKLNEVPVRRGNANIPRGKLQKAETLDLTNMMVSFYTEKYAVQLTAKVLKAINCKDRAEELLIATGNRFRMPCKGQGKKVPRAQPAGRGRAAQRGRAATRGSLAAQRGRAATRGSRAAPQDRSQPREDYGSIWATGPRISPSTGRCWPHPQSRKRCWEWSCSARRPIARAPGLRPGR